MKIIAWSGMSLPVPWDKNDMSPNVGQSPDQEEETEMEYFLPCQ